MSVFSTTNTKSHLDRTLFFDQSVDLARYDKIKYPQFGKLISQQLSYYWNEEEIDLSRDSKDFKGLLTSHEQFLYTANLKRQVLLDSVQGRAPSLAFLPICSLPELENWIQAWTFFETIHSRSYTHIIRNVYTDPSKIFDDLLDIQEIIDCAKDISKYYDELILWNAVKHKSDMNPSGGTYGKNDLYEHKKSMWKCLNAVNALEGVRFYVSFACSWNFAELKKMEGNAKIIKLIARDENLHLAATQQLIKLLPKDDPDFVKIEEECREECTQIFIDVVNQEKAWAKYLFKDGSMIGLNERLLCDYVEWIAKKRMTAVGLTPPYQGGSNPLPWTQKWIAGADVQVAPQETEISAYVLGSVKQDVDDQSFTGFTL